MNAEPAHELFGDVFVNEIFDTERVDPRIWDRLLAEGWRHCSTHFFRHSFDFTKDGDMCTVLPLRIRLKDFKLTKSQEKILKRNRDLNFLVRRTFIDEVKHRLFEQHKARFTYSIPETIHTFISDVAPNRTPCDGYELCVYDGDAMIACSFFDLGMQTSSGTYAMFDLRESKRSLGIFTMILEILYAKQLGMEFYYPGYAYDVASFYDYKKKFVATEFFDWKGKWIDL